MNHNGRNGTNVPQPRTREERGRIIAEHGEVILPGRDLSFADLAARMRDYPCGVRSQTDDGVWYQVTRWGCTCQDWLKRSEVWRVQGGPRPELCKHQWAVVYAAQRLPRGNGHAEAAWDGTCPHCGGGTVCRMEPYGGSAEPPRLVDLCLCGWSQEARPRRAPGPLKPEASEVLPLPREIRPGHPLPGPNGKNGGSQPVRARPPAPPVNLPPSILDAEWGDWDWGDLLEGPAPPTRRERQFQRLL